MTKPGLIDLPAIFIPSDRSMRQQTRHYTILLPIVLTGLIFTPGLWAEGKTEQSIPRLMEEKRCDLCHHRNERRVGPPYEMIASLHADRKDEIIDKLVKKIIEGGGGTWGAMPMPANSHVSEKEARAMAEWIMGLE